MKFIKKHISDIIALFLLFIIALISYNFLLLSFSPAYHDDFPYKNDSYIKDIGKNLYLWDSSEFGGKSIVYGGEITRFPIYHFMFILLTKLNIHFNISERLFYFYPLIIGYLSSYIFFKSYTKDVLSSFIGTLFLMINPTYYVRIARDMQLNLLIPVSFLPLLFYLISKFFKTLNFFILNLMILILWFISFYEIRMFFLTYFITGIFYIYNIFLYKQKIKKIFLYTLYLIVVLLLLNLYWIYFIINPIAPFTTNYTPSLFYHYNFFNLIIATRDDSFIHFYKFKIPFLIFPFLLILYFLYKNKLKKEDKIFIILFIFFLLSSLWTQPEFENLRNILLQKFHKLEIIFIAFRDPAKFVYIYIFLFSYLLTLSIKNLSKKVKIFTIIFMIFIYSDLFFGKYNISIYQLGYGLHAQKSYKDYIKASKYLNSQNPKFKRVIVLEDDPEVSFYNFKTTSLYLNDYSVYSHFKFPALYLKNLLSKNKINNSNFSYLSGLLNINYIYLWPKDEELWAGIASLNIFKPKNELDKIRLSVFNKYKNKISKIQNIKKTNNEYVFKLNNKLYGRLFTSKYLFTFLPSYDALSFFIKNFRSDILWKHFLNTKKFYPLFIYDLPSDEALFLSLDKNLFNNKNINLKIDNFSTSFYKTDFVTDFYYSDLPTLKFENNNNKDYFIFQVQNCKNLKISDSKTNINFEKINSHTNFDWIKINTKNIKNIYLKNISPECRFHNFAFISENDLFIANQKLYNNLNLLVIKPKSLKKIKIIKNNDNKKLRYKQAILFTTTNYKYTKPIYKIFLFAKNTKDIKDIKVNDKKINFKKISERLILLDNFNINNANMKIFITQNNTKLLNPLLFVQFDKNIDISQLLKDQKPQNIQFVFYNPTKYEFEINDNSTKYITLNENLNKNFTLYKIDSDYKTKPFLGFTCMNSFKLDGPGKYIIKFDPQDKLFYLYKIHKYTSFIFTIILILSFIKNIKLQKNNKNI